MSFSVHNSGFTGSFPHGAAKRRPVVIEGNVVAKQQATRSSDDAKNKPQQGEPFQNSRTHTSAKAEHVIEAQAVKDSEQLLGSKSMPKSHTPYGAYTAVAHSTNHHALGSTIDTYA